MHKEINALGDNKTSFITTLPHGKKILGYKWVYEIKYNFDAVLSVSNIALSFLAIIRWGGEGD